MTQLWQAILKHFGELQFDTIDLLKLRKVSVQFKLFASKALGVELSRRLSFSSLKLTNPDPDSDLTYLHSLCKSLNKPLKEFTICHNIIVQYSRGTKQVTIMPPLKSLIALCNIGICIEVMLRVVVSSDYIEPNWLKEKISINAEFNLPNIVELYSSERDGATWHIIETLLINKMPDLKSLAITRNTLTPTMTSRLYLYANRLPKLTSLILYQNGIISRGLDKLELLTKLRSLDLSANYLRDDPQYLLNVLKHLSRLTRLNLSSNLLSNQISDISSVLKNTTTLKWLDLSSNSNYQDHHIMQNGFANMLPSLTALTWLNISSNDLKCIRCLNISGLTKLTHLDISMNSICERVGSYVPWLVPYDYSSESESNGQGMYYI
jgi:hypothetical protein